MCIVYKHGVGGISIGMVVHYCYKQMLERDLEMKICVSEISTLLNHTIVTILLVCYGFLEMCLQGLLSWLWIIILRCPHGHPDPGSLKHGAVPNSTLLNVDRATTLLLYGVCTFSTLSRLVVGLCIYLIGSCSLQAHHDRSTASMCTVQYGKQM